jgi:hypothetical protein
MTKTGYEAGQSREEGIVGQSEKIRQVLRQGAESLEAEIPTTRIKRVHTAKL